MLQKQGSSVDPFDRHPGTVRERIKRGGMEERSERDERDEKVYKKGRRGVYNRKEDRENE